MIVTAQAKMKSVVEILFEMENCGPLLRKVIHNQILNVDEVIQQIFDNIHQLTNEENRISLAKLVCELCVKEKNLSMLEQRLKQSSNESNSAKNAFIRKTLIAIGNKRLFY